MAFEKLNFKSANWVDHSLKLMLSSKTRVLSERVILIISIASYLIHLLLIFLANQGIITTDSKFLTNPISAIYTPFSFILIYEVYMLIFYLPKSTSFYIGKQYEIITLIVIRRIFKDIGKLELHPGWFQNDNDLQFTYDAFTSLILFYLIYLFYKLIQYRELPIEDTKYQTDYKTNNFIFLKKCIAIILVPILIIIAFYSFTNWVGNVMNDQISGINSFSNINNIFFDEFFTVLIIVDVLLLLASFFYSDKFHTIIRNSGFVISTILIKISFSTKGILNNTLISGSVLFGLMILFIHNMYEKRGAKMTKGD